MSDGRGGPGSRKETPDEMSLRIWEPHVIEIAEAQRNGTKREEVDALIRFTGQLSLFCALALACDEEDKADALYDSALDSRSYELCEEAAERVHTAAGARKKATQDLRAAGILKTDLGETP